MIARSGRAESYDQSGTPRSLSITGSAGSAVSASSDRPTANSPNLVVRTAMTLPSTVPTRWQLRLTIMALLIRGVLKAFDKLLFIMRPKISWMMLGEVANRSPSGWTPLFVCLPARPAWDGPNANASLCCPVRVSRLGRSQRRWERLQIQSVSPWRVFGGNRGEREVEEREGSRQR